MPDKTPEEWRREFLLQMYGQLWNNINRHLTVVWQSVSVLGGAIAVFALVEKNVLSVDFATAAVVLLCSWVVTNAYEASGWFNRNQAIITNIEREFLTEEDLAKIHPYFAKHRDPKSMQGHIRIQLVLAAVVAISVTVRHFVIQLWPGIGGPWSTIQLHKALPYIMFVVGLIWISAVRNKVISDQNFFLQKSGKPMQLKVASTAPPPPLTVSGLVPPTGANKPQGP